MKIDLLVMHLLISSVAGFGIIQPHNGVTLTVSNRSIMFIPKTRSKSNTALSSTPGQDEASINVLGTRMECCCADVRGTGVGTGFYRNGYCSTGAQDVGRHTVCVQVTDDFLEFSKSVGNDLSTPFPEYMFPGLREGDVWCLCAQRWVQAYQAGKAPKLFLQATHEKTLDYVRFEVLREYALDKTEADEAKGALDEQRDKLTKLFENEEAEEPTSPSD